MNASGNIVDPGPHLWWLASRASGIVAILLLTYTVLVGLMMGGKLVQRVAGRPGRGGLAVKRLLESHEYASIAALVAIVVHAVTLLGDAYLHPSLGEVAVPFTMAYRSFYTGLGVIGAYLAILLGLSFYARARIGTARWKKLHRWTLGAYGLAVVHALGAGTDAASSWFEIPLLASAGLVVVTFLARASSVGRSRAQVRRAPSPPQREAAAAAPARNAA